MHMQQTAKALKGNKRLNLMDENKEKNKITSLLAGAGKWWRVALEEFV